MMDEHMNAVGEMPTILGMGEANLKRTDDALGRVRAMLVRLRGDTTEAGCCGNGAAVPHFGEAGRQAVSMGEQLKKLEKLLTELDTLI